MYCIRGIFSINFPPMFSQLCIDFFIAVMLILWGLIKKKNSDFCFLVDDNEGFEDL